MPELCEAKFILICHRILSLQVLGTLGTEQMRPSSAAQCVAYIACAELPTGLWPDLIQCLTQNVTNPASTEMMKESSLEAIGYICMDIVSVAVHMFNFNDVKKVAD